MLLFRSEEHVRRAYEEPGAIIPAERLWQLADAWYRDRLAPEWRPRPRDDSQAILDRLGLTDAFWQLS